MSDEVSDNLALPFLQPSQAQKHVTHNEALERLDILVQLTVEAFDATTPPSLPEAGEVHALGTGASEAWVGHDGELAAWVGEAWLFIAPRAGWRAWSRGAGTLRIWDGSGWVGPLDDIDSLGINATADSTNRLAVAAPGTLLNHEGDDHRLVINKAGEGDTASLLFQSGFSGRAEMGLAGTDDYGFRVSPDGSDWIDALTLDAASGAATLRDVSADSYGGDGVTSGHHDPVGGKVLALASGPLRGIFGLGALEGCGGWPNADFDDVSGVGTGFYRRESGVNLNGLGGNGVMQYMQRAVGEYTQTWHSVDGAIFYRVGTGDAAAPDWADWVPALPEITENANGTVMRWGNVQLCTRQVRKGVTPSEDTNQNWDFPASFEEVWTTGWSGADTSRNPTGRSGHQPRWRAATLNVVSNFGSGTWEVTCRPHDSPDPDANYEEFDMNLFAIGTWR